MKDLSVNPLENTNDIAATYAPLASTVPLGKAFASIQVGDQNLTLKSSSGASMTTSISSGTSTGGMTVFVAPYPCQVQSCWFSFYAVGSGTTLPLSNTNYWIFGLRKNIFQGSTALIAQGTTQSTGTASFGVALVPNQGYNLTQGWNATNATLDPGDFCQFTVTTQGTITTVPRGIFTISVAYAPV